MANEQLRNTSELKFTTGGERRLHFQKTSDEYLEVRVLIERAMAAKSLEELELIDLVSYDFESDRYTYTWELSDGRIATVERSRRENGFWETVSVEQNIGGKRTNQVVAVTKPDWDWPKEEDPEETLKNVFGLRKTVGGWSYEYTQQELDEVLELRTRLAELSTRMGAFAYQVQAALFGTLDGLESRVKQLVTFGSAQELFIHGGRDLNVSLGGGSEITLKQMGIYYPMLEPKVDAEQKKYFLFSGRDLDDIGSIFPGAKNARCWRIAIKTESFYGRAYCTFNHDGFDTSFLIDKVSYAGELLPVARISQSPSGGLAMRGGERNWLMSDKVSTVFTPNVGRDRVRKDMVGSAPTFCLWPFGCFGLSGEGTYSFDGEGFGIRANLRDISTYDRFLYGANVGTAMLGLLNGENIADLWKRNPLKRGY